LDQIQQALQKENWKKNSQAFFPFRQRSSIAKVFPFGSLPEEGVDKKLSLFSTEFREFIQLQLISLGNFYSDRFPLSLATQVLFKGTSEFNSDIDSEKLEKEILNQFLRAGGRIEEIDGVKKIEFGWRKECALTLEGNPAVFRSQFLVINFPLHRSSPLLRERKKGFLKWEKKIKPLYMRVPLFLGVDEKVIPVGMENLVISILDLEKSYEDGNVVLLSISSKGDKTRAPEGKRAITVESLMDVEKWGQVALADYQQGVMGHLYHLFPYLEHYTELFDFQWASDHISTWSYPHYLYQATSDFNWRQGVVPVRMSKSIYFVGKENFPYLGLGGEVFSGLTAAQHILKKFS
jgi:phytoene dehydrogenase-like protein